LFLCLWGADGIRYDDEPPEPDIEVIFVSSVFLVMCSSFYDCFGCIVNILGE
jgi:hypothetical protein